MATATKSTGQHVPLVGKKNAGYTITAQRPRFTGMGIIDPHSDVVLAVCLTDEHTAKFVTWVYIKETKGFIWGHYGPDLMTAYNDFLTR